MDAKKIVVCTILFVIVQSGYSSLLNILLVSAPFDGHANRVLAVGEQLVLKGHNVTYCSLDNWVNLKEKAIQRGMKYMSAGQHGVTQEEWIDIISRRSAINGFSSHNPLKIIEELSVLSVSKPLSGVDAIAEYLMTIDLQVWDIIVTEHYLLHRVPCIAKNKSRHIVALVATYYSNESPPWPFPVYQSGHSDELTFKERMMTAIATTVWRTLSLFSLQWFILGSPSTKSLCVGNFKYPVELGWEIPLIISTVIGLEYPRTASPLTNYVGPILSPIHINSPLPNELVKWLIKKNKKSVIFITMGSQTMISKELASAFINSTKNFNYSVVWSLNRVNKNILTDLSVDKEQYFISPWVPQISLFQHQALSLAILHGGSNGIHESLYFGIPSIVIPATGDQFDWAVRVHSAKVGIYLQHNQVNSAIIKESIIKIVSEGYHERAHFMSILMRRGGGVIKAANLVEFYGTYGYKHLIPAPVKYQWNWIQYYNLDIFAIPIVGTLVTMWLFCSGSRCYRLSSKKKVD